MVIQIDGGASTNKGAQLMMAAVIQEIKKSVPDAKLIVNNNHPDGEFVRSLYGDNYTLLRSDSFYRTVSKFHLIQIASLFSRRMASYFTTKYAIKGVDVVFNIGGFQFGDQWNHSDTNVASWRDYLVKLHQLGTFYVFLPQAFGPFQKTGSKKILQVLNREADILVARDDVSYDYMIAEKVDKNKVLLFPDFTASVEGVETETSTRHKNKVCIIPNSKIIQTGVMDKEEYINSIATIIGHIYEKGKEVILLNHEGKGDYVLCNHIASVFDKKIDVISGLNSLETKGLIAASYLVLSSRFHGVANSLSSSVPCLATSWSHKYQKLLEEYAQGECLLDLKQTKQTKELIDKYLDENNNRAVRRTLAQKNNEVKCKNREMWNILWSKIK